MISITQSEMDGELEVSGEMLPEEDHGVYLCEKRSSVALALPDSYGIWIGPTGEAEEWLCQILDAVDGALNAMEGDGA